MPIPCCIDDGRFAVKLQIRQLGCLKSELCAEECMDTLEDLLCFQTHLGILGFPCLRQSIGILNGMASILWISSRVWNHLHNMTLPVMSTTYHSMLGVCVFIFFHHCVSRPIFSVRCLVRHGLDGRLGTFFVLLL